MALTPIETIRLLIADQGTGPEQLFTDDQLQAFLTLSKDSINRAAARALLTIAASETLVGKKIRTQDLSTDGPAVAESLRKLAQDCMAAALEEEAAADTEAEYIDFIPFGGSTRLEAEEYRW